MRQQNIISTKFENAERRSSVARQRYASGVENIHIIYITLISDMRMTEKQHLRPGFTRPVLRKISRVSDIVTVSVYKQEFVTGKLGEDLCWVRFSGHGRLVTIAMYANKWYIEILRDKLRPIEPVAAEQHSVEPGTRNEVALDRGPHIAAHPVRVGKNNVPHTKITTSRK